MESIKIGGHKVNAKELPSWLLDKINTCDSNNIVDNDCNSGYGKKVNMKEWHLKTITRKECGRIGNLKK